MQNWKIRRMSVMKINQWLSAIGKLLRHYEGKVKLNRCPLCDITSGKLGCGSCPWKVIEKTDCFLFAIKIYGWGTPTHFRSNLQFKKWKTLRLLQLRSWREIFKLELARRDV